MEAITSISKERHEYLSALTKNLREKTEGTSKYKDWFEDYKQTSGYAHYKFSGKVSDKLVELLGHEPTSEEIILLVDDGFSHFGASCSMNGRSFSGRVNTD